MAEAAVDAAALREGRGGVCVFGGERTHSVTAVPTSSDWQPTKAKSHIRLYGCRRRARSLAARTITIVSDAAKESQKGQTWEGAGRGRAGGRWRQFAAAGTYGWRRPARAAGSKAAHAQSGRGRTCARTKRPAGS